MIGTTEIIIVLAIALLVFGPQKLPEIGRQIGSAMRELRKMSGDVQRALDLDEYTRLDSPHYGSSNYGTTYPSTDSSNAAAPDSYDTEADDEYARQHAHSGEPAALSAAATADTDFNGVGHETEAETGRGFAGLLAEPPGPPAATAATNGTATTAAAAATTER